MDGPKNKTFFNKITFLTESGQIFEKRCVENYCLFNKASPFFSFIEHIQQDLFGKTGN